MNQHEVRSYLDNAGKAENDLVILPRRYFNLIQHKDIGISAIAILENLCGITILDGKTKQHPIDVSALRSCLRLVKDFPELRERISEMTSVSPEWAVIVTHWDELDDAWRNGHRIIFGGPPDLDRIWVPVKAEIDSLSTTEASV